jgi:WS/DGAT/MGAT family acyltransferase
MGAVANRLSDADALIWRIEGDPVLRSPILVIGLLDREPPWPRVLASLRRTVVAIPRLHQRVVSGPLGARPCWVDDDAFSLEHHVRRVRAATADGVRAVLDVAEPDVMTAFDPARPPWQLTIVDGLEGGAAAFVLRFHHTITDGVGGIGLTEHLFDSTRRPGPGIAPDGQHAPQPESAGREGSEPRPGAAGAIALGLVRAGLDPVGAVLGGVRTARSVARMLAPARAPLSPLMHGRGLDRRLHVLDMPLAGLQRAARQTGGTVNDVLLAAIGGGLREYHEACGTAVDALRITMPISIRKEGDAPGGNHFTPARFVLPVDDPDPRHRIELAGAIVRAVRAEPAVRLTPVLARALGLLPAPLVQRAFAGMLRSMDVDAVDVPGLQSPAFLAGSRVERLWAFAPPTGAAMSITLVSHLQSACIGIAADTAAVADPELLATCLEHGFDQVLALADEGLVSGIPA